MTRVSVDRLATLAIAACFAVSAAAFGVVRIIERAIERTAGDET